jgi:hypothetical protein
MLAGYQAGYRQHMDRAQGHGGQRLAGAGAACRSPPPHQGRWRDPQLARVPAQRGRGQQSSAMPGPGRTLMLAAMPAAREPPGACRRSSPRHTTRNASRAGGPSASHRQPGISRCPRPILPNRGRCTQASLCTARHVHSDLESRPEAASIGNSASFWGSPPVLWVRTLNMAQAWLGAPGSRCSGRCHRFAVGEECHRPHPSRPRRRLSSGVRAG